MKLSRLYLLSGAVLVVLGCGVGEYDESGGEAAYSNERKSQSVGTLPLYRLYHPYYQRFQFTSNDPNNPSHYIPPGWINTGSEFSILTSPAPNRVFIKQCWHPYLTDYFLSTSPNCEGFAAAPGGWGWIAAVPEAAASRPLYRCFNQRNRDIVATVNPQFCYAAGYQIAGLIGYVP